jgi:hypothetical protein
LGHGRAPIEPFVFPRARILEEHRTVERLNAPTVDIVIASVGRAADIGDFGKASDRRIFPKFVSRGDGFVTPVRLGAILFPV